MNVNLIMCASQAEAWYAQQQLLQEQQQQQEQQNAYLYGGVQQVCVVSLRASFPFPSEKQGASIQMFLLILFHTTYSATEFKQLDQNTPRCLSRPKTLRLQQITLQVNTQPDEQPWASSQPTEVQMPVYGEQVCVYLHFPCLYKRV